MEKKLIWEFKMERAVKDYEGQILEEIRKLPDDKVREIIKFIAHLKEKEESTKKVIFKDYPLGVKSKLTREEIYED